MQGCLFYLFLVGILVLPVVALWNQVQSQGHPHWCLLCASASEMVTEIGTALALFFRNILTQLYISEMILNDIRLIHKRKEFETTDAYLHMKEVIWLGIYPTHAYIGMRWFTLWRCLLFSTGFMESREVSWGLDISFLATKCWMKRILMSVSFFFLSPKRQPYNKIFFFPASSYFAHLQRMYRHYFSCSPFIKLIRINLIFGTKNFPHKKSLSETLNAAELSNKFYLPFFLKWCWWKLG